VKRLKKQSEDPLATWINLNDALRQADEKTCVQLMIDEQQGRRRKMFLLRIHSRLNLVRAQRERQALLRSAA